MSENLRSALRGVALLILRVICGLIVACEMAWGLLLFWWTIDHSLSVAIWLLALCGFFAGFLAVVTIREDRNARARLQRAVENPSSEPTP